MTSTQPPWIDSAVRPENLHLPQPCHSTVPVVQVGRRSLAQVNAERCVHACAIKSV